MFLEIFTKPVQTLRYLVTGFCMGAADVVPGVSGGTIAFLFGIYEQLIDAIKISTGEALRLFFSGRTKESFSVVPFHFLLPLGTGVLLAIVSLAKVLEHALAQYPEQVWGFFFGLVLASVVVLRTEVSQWNWKTGMAAVLASIAGYLIVGMVPTETPANYLAFFLAGSIAICAMILPGVSGSFLLLMMGKYKQILAAVTSADYLTLGIFMLGAVVGIAVFSRILSYLFKQYHDVLVAALIGLMIGSLRKLWPWKDVIESMIDRHGNVIPLKTMNYVPTQFSTQEMLVVGLACFAFVLILVVTKVGKHEKKTTATTEEVAQ